MEKYNFKNEVFAKTDSFYNWKSESISLGFVNYTKGAESRYYSYEEVEKLFNDGLLDDNIYIKSDGRLGLKSSYLSYCECFDIICGKVIEDTKYNNLLEYAKKIGVAHDEFQPNEGWFGIKEIKKSKDDYYDMTYKFKNKIEERMVNYIGKICIGGVKRIAGERTYISCGGGRQEVKKRFECKDVVFDKEDCKLIIKDIPKKYIVGEINEFIKMLDLELWMITNKNKEWDRFFWASVMMVKDEGQEHYFSHLKRENARKESNYNWHDKTLGEIWEEE